jgi:hypothetical protein
VDETDRAIMAAILALLWLGVVVVNIIYLWGHVQDRTLDGPSPLPIVGSIFGLLVLVTMPWGTVGQRLLWLPAALLPDLMTVAAYQWISWVNRHRG